MAGSKAPKPPSTPEELDERDACILVEAAGRAVAAIESIRSRMVGRRDATSATGQLLHGLVTVGGVLREFDRPKVWALRHALGGEGFEFRSPHDAAAHILGALVHGLRPAATPEEAVRHENAKGELLALAKILALSEHSIEASRNVEEHDRATASARAAAHKAAHDARLAGRPSGPAPAPRPPPPPKVTREQSLDGDYALPGSVDAPGGNPFPTSPVG